MAPYKYVSLVLLLFTITYPILLNGMGKKGRGGETIYNKKVEMEWNGEWNEA